MGKRAKKKLIHPYLGPMSKHHLIPKQRIKEFYGEIYRLPYNLLKIWRFKHDAWHRLFNNKTLNEVIEYLDQSTRQIYNYNSTDWKILFKDMNQVRAQKLLLRVNRIIRKKDIYQEFDMELKRELPLLQSNVVSSAPKIYVPKVIVRRLSI